MKHNKDTLMSLFLGFGIYQLFLHIVYAFAAKDPRVLMPTSIAFIHDLFVLLFCYIVLTYAKKLFPLRFEETGETIFIIIFLITGGLLALYPRVLREFLIFPVNLFEADVSTTKTFIVDYLGFSALLPTAFSLFVGVAIILSKRELAISRPVKQLGVLIIVISSVIFLKHASPQPIIYSLQSTIASVIKHEQRVVPSLSLAQKEHRRQIPALAYPESETFNYDHIVMIVLEGVTAADFEQEFITIDQGFFATTSDHSAYYSNYYATNLDSYTALIAMMTGIQVPYRCYADEQYYERVNHEKNVIDYLTAHEFTSIFVSTFEYHPFIPVRNFWKKTLLRKDFAHVDQFLSIGSSKMEMATEDKLALDRIIDEMKHQPKTVVMHELAYGHSPEWRATTGKTQLAYYNEYLLELQQKLTQEHLADRALLVIVSDHGDRAQSASMENYRVPLLIVGKHLEHHAHAEFLSHLDFPEIMFQHIITEQRVPDVKQVFVVGSSEKWVYGQITAQKDYLFIDNAKGTVINRSDAVEAASVHAEFQIYLNTFNAAYGKE